MIVLNKFIYDKLVFIFSFKWSDLREFDWNRKYEKLIASEYHPLYYHSTGISD